MKKGIWIFVLLLLLVGGGYFAWKWYFQKGESIDAFKLVPADAVFVVQTDEPVEGWKEFSKSAMWNHVKQFKPLGEIGKMADALSETIEDNDLIFSAFGSRNVLISLHVTAKDDYDFLYVCDMKEGAKFSTVKDGIIKLLSAAGFEHKAGDVSGQETHAFYDPKDKSTLHIAFVANQLVCSYNTAIFEASLKQKESGYFNKDEQFSEIASSTPQDGMCRIYLNHTAVPNYLGVYMDDISSMKGLFSSMFYTGLSVGFEEDDLAFKGYTSVNDSMSSQIRALHRSGKSNTHAQTVFSENTAFMLSMGFQSFGKFYENLKDVMKEDAASWDQFNKKKKTIETLLRFKLEEDLLGWIDDEVSIAQYEQERVIGSKIHTVAAIKHLSEEKAKEKLGKLEKRLKLLGKFQTSNYKEYEIHYMEIRGLFRLLFGKLFEKIEKPYYTFIDGYVVFCDDPATLLKTIDDHIAGKTLANLEEYKDFAGEFKEENTLSAWLNMKKYFLNLKGILDAPSYSESYTNREYIICFQQMGFQFIQEDNRFDTRMRIRFKEPNEYDLEITEGKAIDLEELEELDSMSDADAFILEHITGSVKKEMYDNGNVKFIAEMENEVLDGRYLEYWENGTLKIKGKYRNGEKSGKWYYYKEDGELERKEKFKRGGGSESDISEELEVEPVPME
jgi:hypothetical protein